MLSFTKTVDRASKLILVSLFYHSFSCQSYTSPNKSQNFSELSDLSSSVIGICCFRVSAYPLLILLQLLYSSRGDSTSEAYHSSYGDQRLTMFSSEINSDSHWIAIRLFVETSQAEACAFYYITAIVIAIYYNQRTACLRSHGRVREFWRHKEKNLIFWALESTHVWSQFPLDYSIISANKPSYCLSLFDTDNQPATKRVLNTS